MASTTLEKSTAVKRDDMDPVLEIEGLNISFFVRAGEIPAVMDFSCRVMPGETMGLVGESGCGKSTVALGIMRDMGNRGKIVGGKIKFKGRDMGEMSEEELRDLRGSKIAMIYQEPMASLNPAMRIGKQLMEVPIIHEKVSETEAYDRALEMLEAVKLPDPKRVMEAYPHQISGGQQQRIVIAMALLSKPDLLLLDEPTTALDVTVEAGIVELVKELGEKTGTSMLFISHNLGLILETCDRITVMYSGEAVETGTVEEVFDRMRHPYTQGLFNSIPLPGADKNSRPLIAIPGQLPLPMERPKGCNFGPRCRFFQEKCDSGHIPMQHVKGELDHRSRCVRIEEIDWNDEPERNVVDQPAVAGDTVLEINDLKKYYDVAANKMFGGGDTRTVKANESITFHAREAETVAIVGESGCGKSTLAKVLLGLETATDGEVLLDGRDIGSTMVEFRDKRTVASVQMVFQNPFDTLNPSHSVGSQIIRTLEKFGMGDSDADRHERMLKLLDLVKLPRAFAERMPRQLSGGQKQRIGVARAFAGEPRVVVADEPVSALDVSVQAAVTELLMDIQREARTTMLFISHDLSIVRYIADRVVVMYLGHIVEQGTTDDIFAPPYHPYTEALLSAIPIADTSVTKKHIVLDGDIPSAMNPPSGCPFQTRCPRKSQVPGTLCETDVPPVRKLANGHEIKCHLAADILDQMEPVIVLGEKGSGKGDIATGPSTDSTTATLSGGDSSGGVTQGAAAGVSLVTGGAAALAGLSAGAEPATTPAANNRSPEDTVETKGMKTATKAKAATGTVSRKTASKPASAKKSSAATKAKAAEAKPAAAKATKPAAAAPPKGKATAGEATSKRKTTAKAKTASTAPAKGAKPKAASKSASAADAKAANRAALTAAVRGKASGATKSKATASKASGSKAATSAKAKTATATKSAASASKSKGTAKTAGKSGASAQPASFVKMRKPKTPDDLKMVSGIGPKIEGILNGMGVYTFEQVSKWKKADRDWVNAELSFKGRIEREDWVKQAKALAKGGEAEYIKVFGKKPR